MHPVLFQLGNIKIYSYGVMMILGFIGALFFILRHARSAGLDRAHALDLAVYSFISGIIGARIFHVLFNLEHFTSSIGEFFNFQGGGLSWHGGLVGGLVFIFIYCRFMNFNLGQAYDLMFFPTILGLVFGRIGCFLNGCCYGKPSSLPWAVTFPYHSNPRPVHPTQLYEFFLVLGLFIFLEWWWSRRKFAGENTLLVFSLYSVIRFVVEFFRFNTPDMMHFGLSLAQWVSIAGFLVLLGYVLYSRSRIPDGIMIGDVCPALPDEGLARESLSPEKIPIAKTRDSGR